MKAILSGDESGSSLCSKWPARRQRNIKLGPLPIASPSSQPPPAPKDSVWAAQLGGGGTRDCTALG